MARTPDVCPRCGGAVTAVVTVVADHGLVQPCGHHVIVTSSADGVRLERV